MSRSKKFWDKRAKTFDQNDNPNSEVRKATYEAIRKFLSSQDQLLDFGCATGSLSFELYQNVQIIHGLDISEEMIKIAKEKSSRQNSQNIIFKSGILEDFPFDSASYDGILAFYVLHLVPDPKQTLLSLKERLKDQGKIILEVPLLGEKSGFMKGILKGFTKIFGLPHLQEFDREGFRSIITSTDLKVEFEEVKGKNYDRYFVVLKKV